MCRFPTKLGIFRQTWLACTPYSCFNRLCPAFFAVASARHRMPEVSRRAYALPWHSDTARFRSAIRDGFPCGRSDGEFAAGGSGLHVCPDWRDAGLPRSFSVLPGRNTKSPANRTGNAAVSEIIAIFDPFGTNRTKNGLLRSSRSLRHGTGCRKYPVGRMRFRGIRIPRGSGRRFGTVFRAAVRTGSSQRAGQACTFARTGGMPVFRGRFRFCPDGIRKVRRIGPVMRR